LVSISDRSKLHWVFKKLIEKRYELYVTTDILSEYAEIIEQHMGSEVSESVMGVIENMSNIHFITKYYQFHLLNDEDDDKFVDCAIAANADFIVSHDNDFKVLENIDFPKVKVIKTEEFKKILEVKKQ
jgi:putative PIN family toxin of toxin-antitoxin system